MSDATKEILEKARERGFSVHATTGDMSKYMLMSSRNVGLSLYPATGEFELYYVVREGFTFSSGKCGSFLDDEHFSKMHRKFRKYHRVLREEEEYGK